MIDITESGGTILLTQGHTTLRLTEDEALKTADRLGRILNARDRIREQVIRQRKEAHHGRS